MKLKFDYTKARKECENQGMVFAEALVPHADIHFTAHGFKQKDVDAAMSLHIWAVKYLFTPKNYSFRQRIKIAIYFIFG